MLTITAITAGITGYVAKSLKENKSIQAFFNDVTDASVDWLKPVFLKEVGIVDFGLSMIPTASKTVVFNDFLPT